MISRRVLVERGSINAPFRSNWRTVARSVPKCFAMVGKAMVTLPWCMTEVSVPTATAAKTHHL